jgi:hypothetical protein
MLSEQMTGLDIAHSYLDAGLWVLPIKPNKKEPYTALAHRGHLSATNDHRVLDKWINFDPDMNIGIACEMSELVVLDFDFRSMGYEGNNFYSECAYLFYDNTMCVETGNGFHYYFECSSQLQMKAKVMDGVDIKYRGYVVAPPSMHPNGFIYKSNGKEMMKIPAQLLERMKSNEVR